jgi:uncharacterized protein
VAVAVALTSPSLAPGIRAQFFLPGTFAPGIVAIWLTARAEGRAGLRALLSRMFRWRVGAHWYLFAVTYMAGARLSAAVAYRLIRGEWPAFGPVPWYLLLAAVAFSTPFQAGEEIGWRGYALPRLASRLGLAPASVLLGVIWAAWHLPLFFVAGTNSTGQPFLPYLLGVTALSVAMAALYWASRGSLLLVMTMHAAINNLAALVPSALPEASNPFALRATLMLWLTVAALWAGAACLLVWMWRRRAGGLLPAVEAGEQEDEGRVPVDRHLVAGVGGLVVDVDPRRR